MFISLQICDLVVYSCATFDEERLRTILNVVANNAAMNVPSRGHLFAIRSASSGLTPTANMSEIFMGLTQVCCVHSTAYY